MIVCYSVILCARARRLFEPDRRMLNIIKIILRVVLLSL